MDQHRSKSQKECSLDRFRKEVGGVHLTVNMGDLVAPQRFVLPYEVVADVDVLHSSMVDRVLDALDAGLGVYLPQKHVVLKFL